MSAPKRKFIQTEPLYYGHSNDDSSYSTRFPVYRYISECNQLSHCSYDNSIMFSIGKNYTIDMSLPFIIKISYSLKTLQLLLSFFYLYSFFSKFSLERLSLRTAGFSVRSKHFSKRSMSLCGPVKIYSHGIYRLL